MPHDALILVLPFAFLIVFGVIWAFLDVRSAVVKPDAAEEAAEEEVE